MQTKILLGFIWNKHLDEITFGHFDKTGGKMMPPLVMRWTRKDRVNLTPTLECDMGSFQTLCLFHSVSKHLAAQQFPDKQMFSVNFTQEDFVKLLTQLRFKDFSPNGGPCPR